MVQEVGAGLRWLASRRAASVLRSALNLNAVRSINPQPNFASLRDIGNGSEATRDRAVNSAVVPRNVRGFAGEKQCFFHRTAQGFRRSGGSCFDIAVGAPGIRIGLPIVEIGSLEQVLHFGCADT